MTDAAATPTSRELRNFGLLLGALFAALFGVLPYAFRHHLHFWPFILAALLWTAALSRPPILRYVHAGWTRLGLALGWVNTRIILTLFFASSIVPVGLVMRLFGRDPMQRRFDRTRDSYRVPSRQRSAQSMESPF